MLYTKIRPHLDRSAGIRRFDEIFNARQKVYCSNLNLTSKAILTARLFSLQESQENGSLIFVSSDCNRAEEFQEDLSLLLGKDRVFFLPDYETLPYEDRSPHYSIRARRLEVLEKIVSGRPSVLVLSVKSLLRKIVSPKLIEKNLISLSREAEIDLDLLTSKLIGFGYEMQTEVAKVGDISRRGGILDIYSPSLKKPVRIEFFGDTVTSCRYFDPFTQVSTDEIEEPIRIVPAREISLDDISSVNPSHWNKIHDKGIYDGIEQDISLLYEDTATILDYLDKNQNRKNTKIVFDEFDLLKKSADNLIKETCELYQRKTAKTKKAEELKNLIPLPEDIFADFEKIIARIDKRCYLSSLPAQQDDNDRCHLQSPFTPQPVFNRDISILQDVLEKKIKDKWQVIIQSDNISQRKRMQESLQEFTGKIDYELGVLHRGFELPDAKLALYTDHEIYNRYKQKKTYEYYPEGEAIVDYESLKPGDYIVHLEHGIGLYEGLKLMDVAGSRVECLSISYADQAKVYVPVYRLNLVSRYVSEDGILPELHKLGGKRWDLAKRRAKKQIEMIADDLIKLYAERSVRQGVNFDSDTVWQTEMEESFLYEDTPDQRRATDEIKADMEAPNPMERLLCGDVGFGKTEVAVRAAFKAINSGWQAAVLVPTTLLAEQHFIVFQERLAQYPINIGMLSRFRSRREIKQDLEDIKQGRLDIVIGTHRLLSKDVHFKKLGLLIIDEEHRFGVRHKEKIRQLKANVDTLYMSATPIPRTLNMALVRLKEMSLIQTSPKARLPIRTNIIPFDMKIIKDAVKRELDRGGQILFVHNRIDTIQSVADKIKDALPGLRIVVGHGRLPERLLEKVMLDFYDHKYDILVATTIVESGIDIPNANTIFINRADMFGLAQLYQIRGRVGRSNRRAYAYLIVPEKLQIIARKRLEALSEYNALGSGYQIAMRDLELRGAGTLLGTKQSGIINSIGFNYYNKLLSEAVESLANGKKTFSDEENNSDNTRIDADFFLPANYIEDEKTRLKLYNRMLKFEHPEQFDEFVLELKDRFGELPAPAEKGISYFLIKMMVDKAKLDSFRIRRNQIHIRFDKKKLPDKNTLENIVAAADYPVGFDDTRQALTMTIKLPESYTQENNKVLAAAKRILSAINKKT